MNISNISGWLLSINRPDNLVADKDLFAMELTYTQGNTNDAFPNGMSNKFFNGNIVAQRWNTLKNTTTGTTANGIQSYNYQYDRLSRLMEGTYTNANPANATNGISLFMHNNNAPSSFYDANGNIKYLKRSVNNVVEDALSYAYNGNQLLNINDTGIASKLFKDKTTAQDYNYDTAGNLTKDLNKDVEIQTQITKLYMKR